MPIYVYKCKDCHSKVEKLRSMDRKEEPVACPSCGGQTHPVMSKPGRFKRGSGWSARMGGAKMPGEV